MKKEDLDTNLSNSAKSFLKWIIIFTLILYAYLLYKRNAHKK